MKRIAVFLIILCGIAVAVAGDVDYALRSLLNDGGMGKEQIDSVMSMPRTLHEVMIPDTTNGSYLIVPPKDLAVFDLDREYLFIIHLRDTVRISKYQMGTSKKKSRGP